MLASFLIDTRKISLKTLFNESIPDCVLKVTARKVSFTWNVMECVKTIRLGILLKVYDSLKYIMIFIIKIHKLIKSKD